MSSTITINFYDSVANIPLNVKTLLKLKEFVSDKFQLALLDVEEFDFFYFSEKKEKIFINNNLDLVRSLFQLKNAKEENLKEIHIAIREGSRLYKEMFNDENINENIEDTPSQIEKIREEIMMKEKELKDILDKERTEREKKEALEAEEKKQKEMIELAVAQQEEKKKLAIAELAKQKEEIMKKAKEESEMINKRIKDNEAKDKAKKQDKKVKKIDDPFVEVQKLAKNLSKNVTNTVTKTFEKLALIEKKKVVKEEEKKKVVHQGVNCDGCMTKNFTGIRYKCTVCNDFDYCEECEEKNYSTHLHPFVKIRIPDVKVNIKVELEESHDKQSNNNDEKKSGGYFNKIISNVNNLINSLKGGKDYLKEAKVLQGKYDLEVFDINQIAKALEEANGDEDVALCKLIS